MTAAAESAFAHCDAELRAGDPDRWLAHLYVPADRRPGLAALYAFNLEIARIRDTISSPMPGEVRLQWWADALQGAGHGDVSSHPVAAALLDTIERYRLPVAALTAMIEARRFDLYDDPMPTLADLEGYSGETAGALFRLASLVVAGGDDPGTADACGHGGVAYALTGLLRAMPLHASRGQMYLPSDILARAGADPADITGGKDTPALRQALASLRDEARRHLHLAEAALQQAPEPVRLALLPLAFTGPLLQRMDKPDYRPFADQVELGALRRQWLLWQRWRQTGRR